MARAAPKPKTAPKPAAKPPAPVVAADEPAPPEHEAAAGEPAVDEGVDPSTLESMELAGFETPDGKLTEAGAALINSEPAADRPPYTGPISPTPAHLIRMTHPGGGVSDGFQTDESGAILVPLPQVEAMKGHGFVVDHLPQPEAV